MLSKLPHRPWSHKIDQFKAAVEANTVTDDQALPGDLETAAEHHQSTEKTAEAARQRYSEAQRKLAGHDQKQEQLQGDCRVAENAKGDQARQVERLRSDLQHHVEKHGEDEKLEQELATAGAQVEAKEEEAEAATEQLQQLQPERVENDTKRAEQAVQNTQAERGELVDEQIRLETTLTAGDLAGLHERLSAAETTKQAAREKLDRRLRQAHAAKRLYDTLCQCRDEARARYLVPLQQQVGRLLPVLLPEAKVDFDEQFQLTQLNRPTAGVDTFDELSGGSQEQIGILVRLAMGLVLAGDEGLTVMLDDALVATDDQRYERMGAVLDLCAQRLQVILATCHWSRYRRLGIPSHQVIDLPAIRQADT